MNNQARKPGKKISHFIPLILIGVGLIISGFAVLKIITFGGNSYDYSVVPSEVNFAAPELTLNDLQGEKVSISDYRDLVLLINNWAIWCPPCKEEMPILARYFTEHRDQGFMLIGIEAGDPIEEVTGFVDDYHLTFPILLDPNNKSLIAFHNDSLPSSYVVDKTGTVILAWTGPINYTILDKYITPLLEQ